MNTTYIANELYVSPARIANAIRLIRKARIADLASVELNRRARLCDLTYTRNFTRR